MKLIRWILGRIIMLIEWLMTPRGVGRSQQEQLQLDAATKHLSLYQLQTCPFCVMVRHAMKKQSLKIKTRDVRRDPSAKAELIGYGGKFQVPCLRIEHAPGNVEWLYESKDIKLYLEENFSVLNGAERSSAG